MTDCGMIRHRILESDGQGKKNVPVYTVYLYPVQNVRSTRGNGGQKKKKIQKKKRQME